jgi:hypothetical protein
MAIHQDTRRLLTLLRAEMPAPEYLEVTRIRNGDIRAEGFLELGKPLAFVDATSAGWDLYTAYGSRTAPGRGAREKVGHLLAAWVDLDDGAPEADALFPPSVRIASGGLTLDGRPKEWWLWLWREPWAMADDRERNRAAAINKALAARYGGCDSWSIDHLARLPGTLNYCLGPGGKPKPLPPGVTPPLLSRILEWHPERRYTPSGLGEWLALDGDGQSPATAPRAEFGDALPNAEAVLEKAVASGISEDTQRMIVDGALGDFRSRSERDLSVVTRLIVDANLADDELLGLFLAYPVGQKMREKGMEKGEAYLRMAIGKARAALSTPAGARPWETPIDFGAPQAAVAPRQTAETAPQLPAEAWLPPFDLYREAVADSTEASDPHHFFSLAAVAGCYLGRRVGVFYGRLIHPVLYVALIGPTGDKKTTAQRRAAEVGQMLRPPLGTITALGSSEGLIDWLAQQEMSPDELLAFGNWRKSGGTELWTPLCPEHRRGLLVLEELASLLLKASNEATSSLISTLTQLYDLPDLFNPPLRGRRVLAERPTLGLLAASTAAWVEMYLRASDVAGGFGNRFCWVTGPAKPPKARPPRPDIGKVGAVGEAIEAAYHRWDPGTVFDFSPAADKLWAAFYMDWTARAREDSGPTAELTKRIPEHAVKLATLYAALGVKAPVIEAEHMAAAVKVAAYLQDSTRRALGEGALGGVPLQKQVENKVLSLLAAGPAGKRELQTRTRVRNCSAKDFNSAVEALLRAGAIEQDTTRRVLRLAAE